MVAWPRPKSGVIELLVHFPVERVISVVFRGCFPIDLNSHRLAWPAPGGAGIYGSRSFSRVRGGFLFLGALAARKNDFSRGAEAEFEAIVGACFM